MTFITTIANQLNKPTSTILNLCNEYQIEVHYDQDGEWIYDDQAEKLLQQELEKPTRYNFRGIECTALQRYMIGDKAMQTFWLGNIIKYLYRRQSVGDLKKARTYLDFWIKEVEENNEDIQ